MEINDGFYKYIYMYRSLFWYVSACSHCCSGTRMMSEQGKAGLLLMLLLLLQHSRPLRSLFSDSSPCNMYKRRVALVKYNRRSPFRFSYNELWMRPSFWSNRSKARSGCCAATPTNIQQTNNLQCSAPGQPLLFLASFCCLSIYLSLLRHWAPEKKRIKRKAARST